jgi:hypothetical protein
MKSSIVNKLEKLVAKNGSNELAQRCLVALRDETSIVYPSTGLLSTQYVSRISKRRAKLNSKKPAHTEGFADLIKGLDAEPEKSVEIYAVGVGKEVFSIFTNASVTKLIGILVSRAPLLPTL